MLRSPAKYELMTDEEFKAGLYAIIPNEWKYLQNIIDRTIYGRYLYRDKTDRLLSELESDGKVMSRMFREDRKGARVRKQYRRTPL